MKTEGESHERSVSSSSSSSSNCSSTDLSPSNENQHKTSKVDSETNIPYETLVNDEDDDEAPVEQQQPKQPVSESTILLNKALPATYGTQSLSATSTYERSKCVSNNGYNSHGSSITTKSSSDNSGSVRTNSGSDNDEESDEEHYNNSTLAKPVRQLLLSSIRFALDLPSRLHRRIVTCHSRHEPMHRMPNSTSTVLNCIHKCLV